MPFQTAIPSYQGIEAKAIFDTYLETFSVCDNQMRHAFGAKLPTPDRAMTSSEII
jgi:hypothetical protein